MWATQGDSDVRPEHEALEGHLASTAERRLCTGSPIERRYRVGMSNAQPQCRSTREAVVIASGITSMGLCGFIGVLYAVETGAWLPGLFYGFALPTISAVDWLRARRRGGESRETADRLLVPVVIGVGTITWMALDLVHGRCP
jgi:hypothetical protein